jgi:hypothetical protein
LSLAAEAGYFPPRLALLLQPATPQRASPFLVVPNSDAQTSLDFLDNILIRAPGLPMHLFGYSGWFRENGWLFWLKIGGSFQ